MHGFEALCARGLWGSKRVSRCNLEAFPKPESVLKLESPGVSGSSCSGILDWSAGVDGSFVWLTSGVPGTQNQQSSSPVCSRRDLSLSVLTLAAPAYAEAFDGFEDCPSWMFGLRFRFKEI